MLDLGISLNYITDLSWILRIVEAFRWVEWLLVNLSGIFQFHRNTSEKIILDNIKLTCFIRTFLSECHEFWEHAIEQILIIIRGSCFISNAWPGSREVLGLIDLLVVGFTLLLNKDLFMCVILTLCGHYSAHHIGHIFWDCFVTLGRIRRFMYILIIKSCLFYRTIVSFLLNITRNFFQIWHYACASTFERSLFSL